MTDFGTDSPYIAAMKAAIFERLPQVVVIDLTHAIAPQDVLQGAFVWCEFTKTFPAGTVHVGVVDPGVGSGRRILATRCGGQYFVCPDNGLLTRVFLENPPSEMIEVTNRDYWRPEISATFHGRDIMAPVAAAIAGGASLAELGPPLDENKPPVLFPVQKPQFAENEWRLEILYVDRFGNLMLDATSDTVPEATLAKFSNALEIAIEVNGVETGAVFVAHYGCLPPDRLALLEGSGGRLELAVVNGNASGRFSAKAGDRVALRLK